VYTPWYRALSWSAAVCSNTTWPMALLTGSGSCQDAALLLADSVSCKRGSSKVELRPNQDPTSRCLTAGASWVSAQDALLGRLAGRAERCWWSGVQAWPGLVWLLSSTTARVSSQCLLITLGGSLRHNPRLACSTNCFLNQRSWPGQAESTLLWSLTQCAWSWQQALLTAAGCVGRCKGSDTGGALGEAGTW
jgi:hypothetical protein